MQKIADLCAFPDETNWPGVSKLPFYKTLKPDRPTKRRVKDVFKSYAFLLWLQINILWLCSFCIHIGVLSCPIAMLKLSSVMLLGSRFRLSCQRDFGSWLASQIYFTRSMSDWVVASLLSDSFDRHALELLERMLTLDPECVSGCSSPSLTTHDIAISNCPLLCRITSEEWSLREISSPPEAELRRCLFWEHSA
jgi:hypothetical protein